MTDTTATPRTQIRTLQKKLKEEQQEKAELQERLEVANHERQMEQDLREKMGVTVGEGKEALAKANTTNRKLEAAGSKQEREARELQKKIRDAAEREEGLKKERDEYKAKAKAKADAADAKTGNDSNKKKKKKKKKAAATAAAAAAEEEEEEEEDDDDDVVGVVAMLYNAIASCFVSILLYVTFIFLLILIFYILLVLSWYPTCRTWRSSSRTGRSRR